MLSIRPEQMALLSAAMQLAFIERVVVRLQSDFPARFGKDVMDEAKVTAFVEAMTAKAGSYGILNEQDVEAFVDCAATLGEDFDHDARFPWARETLDRQDLRATAKVSLLNDHLIFAA